VAEQESWDRMNVITFTFSPGTCTIKLFTAVIYCFSY